MIILNLGSLLYINLVLINSYSCHIGNKFQASQKTIIYTVYHREYGHPNYHLSQPVVLLVSTSQKKIDPFHFQ